MTGFSARQLDARAIYQYVPHRPPMLLVDEAVWEEPRRLRALKTFRGDEFFLQGHFPEEPVVPGMILCECVLQAGALLAALQHESKVDGALPVVTRLQQVRFKRIVRPGDTVAVHVALTERVGSAFYMQGTIRVQDALAVSLDFACMLVERTQL